MNPLMSAKHGSKQLSLNTKEKTGHFCLPHIVETYLFVFFDIKINLTSISHQQLLRGGMPVRVLVLSRSDDIDAVGAF